MHTLVYVVHEILNLRAHWYVSIFFCSATHGNPRYGWPFYGDSCEHIKSHVIPAVSRELSISLFAKQTWPWSNLVATSWCLSPPHKAEKTNKWSGTGGVFIQKRLWFAFAPTKLWQRRFYHGVQITAGEHERRRCWRQSFVNFRLWLLWSLRLIKVSRGRNWVGWCNYVRNESERAGKENSLSVS